MKENDVITLPRIKNNILNKYYKYSIPSQAMPLPPPYYHLID